MKKNDLLVWTSANALGFGIGFVASLQMIFLIRFGFDWEMHWHWVGTGVDKSALSFVSVLIGPLVGMAIFGSTQALAVRSQNVRLLQWTLATVAGFGVLVVAIQWPLMALGVCPAQ